MNTQKLLVRGTIEHSTTCAICGEVWRGMLVLDRDNLVAGVVAAVVLDGSSQLISHILLGQLPPTAVYHLVPIHLLERLDRNRLWLRIPRRQIAALPTHQPER
ncbi:MAG: hypothetical protein R6X32_14355 [Chloroflexota bacterium]|jgi:hypothetical protein